MADSEKPKGGIVQLLVPVLMIAVVGLGTGFGLSKMLAKPPDSIAPGPTVAKPAAVAAATPTDPISKTGPEAAPAAVDTHGDKAADADAKAEAHSDSLLASQQKAMALDLGDTALVPLIPVVANLAVPSTSWIRLEGSLAVRKSGDAKPADIAQVVTPKILEYLKTLKLTDVSGPDSVSFLNMDLNEIVRSASGGQVRAVLMTGFIVE